jgi:signal transduction histidine kinase
MPAEPEQKRLYLVLRYVFVAAASYLLLFHSREELVPAARALAIALALASNVMLSLLPARVLFAWWVSAPVLIADTVWAGWTLHAVGGVGEEFFLLYLVVLVLAAVSENVVVVVVGATIASGVNLYTTWGPSPLTAHVLLRAVFLFTVAVFYGHVLARIRSERRRGDRSLERSRRLEAEVAQRTAELQRLYEVSRAASEAKTDFVASVSHELRTPLHIIIGYADMLVDGAPAMGADHALLGGRIRTAAAGLLHLVDSVLEIGRLESGTLRVETRPVPARAVARDLARREWITPHAGVTLRWEIPETTAVVETDPGKLEIVLSNLVTNALKYTHAGEVLVAVDDRPGAASVAFRVADTGLGIPASRLARMREPFHESTGTTHHLGGLGLGLSIVYRYAALLDVDVGVDSAVGRGTTFVVTVPYRRLSSPSQAR